jgi:uncharacterized membrane protein YedE/YeeE
MLVSSTTGAIIGGLLVGCAAGLLLVVNGKIFGVSGIVSKLFEAFNWRWGIVLGLIVGGFIILRIHPDILINTSNVSVYQIIVGGFLVGFGTQISNGCTSGHGICGLGRLSPRSILATGIFILTAVITHGIWKYLL